MRTILLTLALAGCAVAGWAQTETDFNPATEDPAVEAPSGDPGEIVDHALQALFGVIALGAAFLFQRAQSFLGKTWMRDVSHDAIAEGVQAAYHDLYKRIRAAAKDRKLTPEERSQLQNYAIERASQLAQGRGVDLAREYSDRALRNLVDLAVGRMKRVKA